MNKSGQIIIVMLFFAGVFFPSSIGDIVSPLLEVLSWLLIVLCCSFLLFLNKDVNVNSVFFGILILLELLLATFVSPFPRISYGAILPFLGYITLISNNWDYIVPIQFFKNILLFVSLVFLFFSFCIITKVFDVDSVLVNYYSGLNPTTMKFMLLLRKPVFTFVVHSYAGFFHFIFFYLNYKTFKCFKIKYFLFISILFMISSVFLRSVSAYIFLIIELGILFYTERKSPSTLFGIGFIGLMIGVYVSSFYGRLVEDISWSDILLVFGSNTNGFKGRFSAESPLKPIIDYILTNPFRPVGITDNPDFLFGDSGYLVMMLRGSLILLFTFYFSFILFFRKNIFLSVDLVVLLTVFLLFDFSNTNILYRRTVSILPFVLVYLNNLYLYRIGSKIKNA